MYLSRRGLLDSENTATAVGDEFLRECAVVVGDQWPSLAFLLSFPTADVGKMKREVVGKRQEKRREECGDESSEHHLTDTEAPADSLTLHHLVKVEDKKDKGMEMAAGRVEDTSQVGLR